METRMFPETNRHADTVCPVCYAAHDEEIHEATLRIRDWFHYQVTNRLAEEEFFAGAVAEFVEAQVA
jgi:hypothetical protein